MDIIIFGEIREGKSTVALNLARLFRNNGVPCYVCDEPLTDEVSYALSQEYSLVDMGKAMLKKGGAVHIQTAPAVYRTATVRVKKSPAKKDSKKKVSDTIGWFNAIRGRSTRKPRQSRHKTPTKPE